MLVLDFSSEYGSLQQAALGFGFELNPVCLVKDFWAGCKAPDFVRGAPDDWSYLFMSSESREEVVEVEKVCQRDDRGLCILAGHRLTGLDVCLHENLLDMTGAITTLKRKCIKDATVLGFSHRQPEWSFSKTQLWILIQPCRYNRTHTMELSAEVKVEAVFDGPSSDGCVHHSKRPAQKLLAFHKLATK